MNNTVNNKFKGTDVIISSNPLFKEDHVWFTTVPLKPLSKQYHGINRRFWKVLNSNYCHHCLCSRNPKVTFREKQNHKLTVFKIKKHGYLILIDLNKLLMATLWIGHIFNTELAWNKVYSPFNVIFFYRIYIIMNPPGLVSRHQLESLNPSSRNFWLRRP